MVSGSSGQSGRHKPTGGLRAGMLIVIVAMAGAFGTWIYKQVDLGPASASAALSGAGADPVGIGPWAASSSSSTSTSSMPPAARRSDIDHSRVRRDGSRSSAQKPAGGSSGKSTGKIEAPAVVVKDSKRRFAIVAFAEGEEALSAGRPVEAILAFDKAIELDPTYADAYYSLGLAYIMAGDRRAAIEQLRRLREMDENLANLLANLLK